MVDLKFSQEKKFAALASMFVFALLVSAGFALALHVISTAAGGSSFTSQTEDVSSQYNFTVNNTDLPTTANITAVMITLPSGFTFTSNTNATNAASTHTFSNNSTTLIWNITSSPGIVTNGSWKYFWFNATAANPGTFNFTVITSNSSGNFTNNTIAVTINDTTSPSAVSYANPGDTSGSNFSKSNVAVNVSATDNGVLHTITVRLYNGSDSLLNTSYSTVGVNSYLINFTGLTDGTYKVNSTVNDTFNNTNQTAGTLTFVVDTTNPSVSFSCSPTSVDIGDTVTCTCSGTDAGSGVNSTSYTANPSTPEYGVFTPACLARDYAGNTGSGSAQYTVEDQGDSGTSGGGGGGGAQLSPQISWQRTVNRADVEFSVKGTVTESLGSRERVQFKIGGTVHSVGVVSVGTSQAVVEIASEPQRVTLTLGQSQKINVDGDGYYDMVVTLVSVTGTKASVQMSPIHEAVQSAQVAAPAETKPSSPASVPVAKRSPFLSWKILGIVIIAGLIVWFIASRRRRA